MKNIIISLLLLFSYCSYSQDLIEKYNELYERYEYFDGDGNLIAYKKYNSLYERWETYNVNPKNETPKSNINLDLLFKVMEMKQKRYDEQRNMNISNNSYNNSLEEIKSQTFREFNKIDLSYYKQNKKNYNEQISKSKNLEKKVNKLKSIDISDLKNGWYKVIIKSKTVYLERFVFVENKKIRYYLDGLNSLYYTKNTNSSDNRLYDFVKIYPDNETENLSCYFITDKPLSKIPETNRVSVIKFYTKSIVNNDKGIFIRIYDKENKSFNFPGVINDQLPYDKNVECIDNNSYYSFKLYLPMNKVYFYQALDDYSFWHSSFYTDETCKLINLKK